jgi:hypothetical protein
MRPSGRAGAGGRRHDQGLKMLKRHMFGRAGDCHRRQASVRRHRPTPQPRPRRRMVQTSSMAHALAKADPGTHGAFFPSYPSPPHAHPSWMPHGTASTPCRGPWPLDSTIESRTIRGHARPASTPRLVPDDLLETGRAWSRMLTTAGCHTRTTAWPPRGHSVLLAASWACVHAGASVGNRCWSIPLPVGDGASAHAPLPRRRLETERRSG